jgi:hypothetical protein
MQRILCDSRQNQLIWREAAFEGVAVKQAAAGVRVRGRPAVYFLFELLCEDVLQLDCMSVCYVLRHQFIFETKLLASCFALSCLLVSPSSLLSTLTLFR